MRYLFLPNILQHGVIRMMDPLENYVFTVYVVMCFAYSKMHGNVSDMNKLL